MSVRNANDESITAASTRFPIADVPDLPTIGTPSAITTTGRAASVPVTAATTGGAPTLYTVTSTPGSLVGTGSTSPITVSGLTNGTSYTFKTTASNSAATTAQTAASSAVTPSFTSLLAFDSIASVALSTNPISFTSIPQTYKHLFLIIKAQGSYTAYSGQIYMTFNADSGANYSHHGIMCEGSLSTPYTYYSTGLNYARVGDGVIPGSYYNTAWGHFAVDIHNYSATDKYKTCMTQGGYTSNASQTGRLAYSSSVWKNTAGITSITLSHSLTSWVSGSRASLFGIK